MDEQPAENDRDHGCTSLRYYGRSGWRCPECFKLYGVYEWPEGEHIDGSEG